MIIMAVGILSRRVALLIQRPWLLFYFSSKKNTFDQAQLLSSGAARDVAHPLTQKPFLNVTSIAGDHQFIGLNC